MIGNAARLGSNGQRAAVRTMTSVSRSSLLIAAVLASGCANRLAVEPQDVPRVVSLMHQANRGATITVNTNIGPVKVDPSQDPDLVLHLDRPCSLGQRFANECDELINAPTRKVAVMGSKLDLRVRTSVFLGHDRKVVADVREIKKARIVLHNWDPPGWRPIWGVGFSAAGASGIAGVNVQVLPASWLAFEVGTLPAADLAAGFAAFRLRPFALGSVRPFVGGFVHGAAMYDASTGDSDHMGAIGPRAGLDLELARGHWIITIEGDLARNLAKDKEYFGDQHGTWLPWGGASVGYFF